jgi:hypothetical protein
VDRLQDRYVLDLPGFCPAALAAFQIPVDERPHGHQNLAHGVGEALLELGRDPVAQRRQYAQQQVQLAAAQAPRGPPVGRRLLPSRRGHVGRTAAAGTGVTTRPGVTTGPATGPGIRTTTGTSITSGAATGITTTTGTGATTGPATGLTTAPAAGSGHGIAKQPLGSCRGSVQTLLQAAERIRVGVRTLSHQT